MERCDHTDLLIAQCAHCQGHVPDWEIKPKPVIYD